ncbi:MAG: hypothetical protein R3C56_38865 [Pirellulaceae bacterium]
MAKVIETELLALPEVKTVFTKTGRPEIANDVMGVNQSDIWVMLKPSSDWPVAKSREDLKTKFVRSFRKKCLVPCSASRSPLKCAWMNWWPV